MIDRQAGVVQDASRIFLDQSILDDKYGQYRTDRLSMSRQFF